jgi:hypothetical protein
MRHSALELKTMLRGGEYLGESLPRRSNTTLQVDYLMET